ncbi:hypothetical protein BSKO_12809 [Bryopsis sp. KO-2023]|nr:hypothetical protein BSKO_12809 [Bryopsis sp. KO-2023]
MISRVGPSSFIRAVRISSPTPCGRTYGRLTKPGKGVCFQPTNAREWRRRPRCAENAPEIAQGDAKLQDTVQALIPEVAALDFPRSEIRSYFAMAEKPPKQFSDFDMSRALPVVDELLRGKNSSTVTDVEALEVVQSILTQLWRWRRRGGGSFDSELSVHQAALQDLQNITAKPESDSEKVTSVLLDDMPISDEDKAQLSGAVRQVAVAGIQSILWNGIGLAVIFLILLNFLGRG